MVYVQREAGKIVAVYSNLQAGFAEEFADDESAEIAEFLQSERIEDYEAAIQSLVDHVARGKQFRDGVTMASYIASTNEQWAAEAQAFVQWRDCVWDYAYAELAKVQTGEREQPSVSVFLTELKPIVWPA